jgi:hypothetical protein
MCARPGLCAGLPVVHELGSLQVCDHRSAPTVLLGAGSSLLPRAATVLPGRSPDVLPGTSANVLPRPAGVLLDGALMCV